MIKDCTTENKELRNEVNRLRQEEDNRRWEQTQTEESAYYRRERERKERNAERLEALRCPDDWPEAFQNSLFLLQKEVNLFPEPGDFFETQLELTRIAEGFYYEEIAAIAPRMDALRKQMEELTQEALSKVANRIDAITPGSMASYGLRENEPSHLTNW